jgi:nucleotide-binding universal stress UspA family protein
MEAAMMKSILVPLDGSALAERALPHAEAIARAAQARLVLMRVAPERTVSGIQHDAKRMAAMQEAELYLTTIAERLWAAGLPAEISVASGDVAEEISADAARYGAYLIVMATHGRGGLGRVVYGSTAEALAQRSPLPLLLIRAGSATPRTLPFSGHPKVIVPLDGSDLAEEALPVAVSLSMALGGALVLLHAVSPFEEATLPEAVRLDFPQREAERMAQAHTYLHTLVARSATGGCQVHCDVRYGAPAEAIQEAVRDHHAALVVMATHGRSALGRLLVGSVAQAVVRHTAVPVMLVRPGQQRDTATDAASAVAESPATAGR